MPSALLAYSFLRASFSDGIRDPIDALTPLVRRAIIDIGTRPFADSAVQTAIRRFFGIDIPLTVLRFTFPKLRRAGVLTLDPHTHIYSVASPPYHDASLIALEDNAKAQYRRVIAHIKRFLPDAPSVTISPAAVIEDWLDNSSLSFLGGDNPAFHSDNHDRSLNRIMLLCLRHDPAGTFLQDITELALGDCLYRAIRAITEHDTASMTAPEFAFRSRMDRVRVFFDTPLVMRALGYSYHDLVSGAREVLRLCELTGCNVCVFAHTVREMKRIFHSTASRIVWDNEISGDIAHYALTAGKTSNDLFSISIDLESEIAEAGLEIVEAPPHIIDHEHALDEQALSERLRLDLHQKSDEARAHDVDCLTAVFRLRDYQPKEFLEKCGAIFVTTNKSLSDTSVRFFRDAFRERGAVNRVQICMTDVVFATRLWTKLPTAVHAIPREQIIAHILSNYRPTQELRDTFISYLNEYVDSGNIDAGTAFKIKLSRHLDELLLLEFDAPQRTLSPQEFQSVFDRLILAQRREKNILLSDSDQRTQAEVREALEAAKNEYNRARQMEIWERNEEVDALKREVERRDAENKVIPVVRQNVSWLAGRVARGATYVILALCAVYVVQLVAGYFGVGGALAVWAGGYGRLIDGVVTLLLAGLTVFGFSALGFVRKVEELVVRKIMSLLFEER